MEKGDLGNEEVPRLLIVFEGAVGYLADDDAVKAHDKAVSKGHWDDALAQYTLFGLMLQKIWDLTFRSTVTIEVVTFTGPEFADLLAARLNDEDVPVHKVWATTPGALARKLPYMPAVFAVYDADAAHVLTYPAGKGRYLTDVNQLGS